MGRSRIVWYGGTGDGWPAAGAPWLTAWLASVRATIDIVPDEPALLSALRRSRPTCVVVDGADGDWAAAAAHACKRDAYTALVPCIVYGADPAALNVARLVRAGADEVLTATCSTDEAAARLNGAIARARRNLDAQPTTGLPGPPAIEAELGRRLSTGVPFAACYADLDHFKEFNDRYGFAEGDRVIRMVARLLHDVVVGVAGNEGFVGHIGGDDFLCIVPLADAGPVCKLVVELFDLIAPLQYSRGDQQAGYYLGKDRRGQLHRVPLMSISIGVVTTERRRLRAPGDVSRLASEMKSFAKTRPGSVYAFDRRGDDAPQETPATSPDHT